MSTTSSEQDARQSLEEARVFITVYAGALHLAKKLLQSAEATGNDTRKFIIVGTDGTMIPGFRNDPLDLPQGNPISANRAFMHVAKMCYDNKDNFIFFDADVTFLRDNVVGRITEDLLNKGGTVLGQPMWTRNELIHGWCFNGNAAYKWDAWEKFNLEEEPIPDDYPFDLWLSKKFFQTQCAPTGLYHNTLPVENITDLDWIPEYSAIHHPCKDGSVADCVIKKHLAHA